MSIRLRRLTISLLCAVSVLFPFPTALLAADPPVEIAVDNSLGNNAVSGAVLDVSDTNAKVAVTNLHGFWTNLTVSGNPKLVPANPLEMA